MPTVLNSFLHRLALLSGGLLVLALLSVGCRSPEAETEVTVSETLTFEPIGRGQRATLDTTEVPIRDAAIWAAYQDSLHPLVPFDTVNFEQEMVLLAAVPVPHGGYSIAFESVDRIDDGLMATYVLSMPGHDCLSAMGEAVVFQAVRLAHSEDPVRFIRERDTYRCTDN